MYIREFSIDRFGILHDQIVSDLQPGITIIAGDNEAGKSTCLNFFRAMFFGYARQRRSIDYAADSKTLSGGSLLMDSKSLGEVRLTRRPGPRGGQAVLTDSRGASLASSDFSLLLRGCTPELFDKVFAFSLDELMHFGSLQDDKIRHALHGAAFGTGLRSPNQVLKELDDAMRRIFAPRAVTTVVHQLLDRMEDIQKTLMDKGNEVERYAALQEEKNTVDQDLAQARWVRESLERERRVCERKISSRRLWLELREARALLEALPEIPGQFAADGIERLDRLEERLENRQAALAGAASALARMRGNLESQAPDFALLEGQGAVNALSERRGSLRRAGQMLQTHEREYAAASRQLREICASLGPDWNADLVVGYDLSLATYEEAAFLGQNLRREEQALFRAEDSRTRAERELRAAQESLALARAQARPLSEGDIECNAGSVDRLHALLVTARDAHDKAREQTAALRTADIALDQAISAISPLWTRQDMERAVFSPADAQTLRTLAREAMNGEAALALLKNKIEQADLLYDSIRQRVARMQETQEELPESGGFGDWQARHHLFLRAQAVWRELETARQRYAAAVDQFDDFSALPSQWGVAAQPEPKPPWFSPRLVGVCLGIAGATVFFLSQGSGYIAWGYAGAMGMTVGAALLLANFLPARFFGAAPGKGPDNATWLALEQRLIQGREKAAAAVAAAEKQLRVLLSEDQELFPDGGCNPEIMAAVEQRILRYRESVALQRRGEAELRREQGLLEDAEKRNEALRRELETLRNTMVRGMELWLRETSARGLPETLVPAELGLFCERFDAALVRRQNREKCIAVLRETENRLADCLSFAKTISDLADILASLPEPGSHLAPEPGAWLDAVHDFIIQWREAGQQHIRDQELLVERESRLAAAQADLRQAEEESRTARARFEQRETAWKNWLERRYFSRELSPETARLALETVGKAQAVLEEIQRREEQTAALREELRAFIRDLARQAQALLADHPALPRLLAVVDNAEAETPGKDPYTELDLNGSADTLLEALRLSCAAAREAEAVYRGREQELPALLDAAAEAEAQVLSTKEAIDRMLREGECESAEQYRHAHDRWIRRQQAETASNLARSALGQEAVAMSISLDELLDSFNDNDEFALEAALQEVLARLDALLEQERQLNEKRGTIAATMATLLSGADAEKLLQQRENIREDLRRESMEWSRLALAKELLLTAKRRFESERQTGVVRRAGELFSVITNGAYSGIIASLDDDRIAAVTRHGSSKNPETELSRGTREQLYLALRLAYVYDHGAQAEKLPVFMDDILVNFDGLRARSAAKALAAFAADHQVLFFTCHEKTCHLLAEAAPKAIIYRLQNGVFSAPAAYSL